MNIRHALRSLKRTPGFTIVVILTLVLGIASVGSMFAIVYGVLLAPLPFGDPERLVSVELQTTAAGPIRQPPAVFATYERFARNLDGVGFYRTGNANLWIDGVTDAPERVTATWMTASMTNVLRVAPLLGRTFTADEEREGGPGAVILSEPEWRARYAAATDVIGKTVTINSVSRVVVGVMPAGFAFPTVDTRVWLPARHATAPKVGDFAYSGVARLAPGSTAAQAQLELTAVLPHIATIFPHLDTGGSTAAWIDETKPTPTVVPLLESVTAGIAHTLWLLAAAAALVLFVAWANVVNLMLIRADARRIDLAVRESLGASPLRIAGHFFGESLLLGTIAAMLALPITYGAVRAVVAFGPTDVPRLAELGIGLPTVAFIALVTLVGVIVGVALPVIRSSRDASINPRDGVRGASTGRAPQRLRATIVTAQIAIALVVSLASALLLRTAYRLGDVYPGFDTHQVTTVRTQLPFARYDEADAVAFYTQLAERVRALPAVVAAGVSMRVPIAGGEILTQTFRVGDAARLMTLPVNIVDEGYFETMRIPLIAGENFRNAEAARRSDVIISGSTAASLFGEAGAERAIGKQLTLAPSGPTYTIIGVVGDVRDHDLATAPTATIYRPQRVAIDPNAETEARRSMALVVRSSAPLETLLPAISRVVRELDPTVPLFNVETMSDVVRESTARLSFALVLMTAAAVVTLLLGTIGLYGVMSYMIALRTREIGVRVALGANPRRIARLVATRGLALTTAGVFVGFVLYAIATPFLRAFLYGVTATDPVTLVATTLLLVAVAAVASWLPARRAARINPTEALRA